LPFRFAVSVGVTGSETRRPCSAEEVVTEQKYGVGHVLGYLTIAVTVAADELGRWDRSKLEITDLGHTPGSRWPRGRRGDPEVDLRREVLQNNRVRIGPIVAVFRQAG
jgi:hypothetical protein